MNMKEGKDKYNNVKQKTKLAFMPTIESEGNNAGIEKLNNNTSRNIK